MISALLTIDGSNSNYIFRFIFVQCAWDTQSLYAGTGRRTMFAGGMFACCRLSEVTLTWAGAGTIEFDTDPLRVLDLAHVPVVVALTPLRCVCLPCSDEDVETSESRDNDSEIVLLIVSTVLMNTRGGLM